MPDGSDGELVFTSLTKQALPIIRYRTRDLTRLLAGGALPMRRMAKVTGRTDDMLIIRGVNVFPSQIEEQLLKCPGLAPHFTIEIDRPGRMDEMTVNVERRHDARADDDAAQTKLFLGFIKRIIGISARLVICEPGALPRSSGKINRILDRRL